VPRSTTGVPLIVAGQCDIEAAARIIAALPSLADNDQ
jgi:hypothetical protein